MSALLQQLPALVGVVIGALGSYLTLTVGDQARFRREQAARWRERRLVAYADYSRALKTTLSVTFRLSAQLGNDPHPHPMAMDEAKPKLDSAYGARDAAWEAMLLLGAREVVEAARGWFLTISQMENFVRDQRRDPAEWSALLAQQRDARAVFYDAARRDLELPAGYGGREPATHGPDSAVGPTS